MSTQTAVSLSQLCYVIVYVPSAARALPFYRDTLGMSVKQNDGDWIEFESGPVTLALHSDKKHSGSSSSTAPKSALPVFQVQDIDNAVAALKAKGVRFISEPKICCQSEGKTYKSADFEDPDGNCLSIFGYTR